MINFLVGIIAVSYAASFVLVYGCTVAYFQHEFPASAPERIVSDRLFALFAALFGPLSFLAMLVVEPELYTRGWKL